MVIQDAQVFNETPLNYRKCSLVLAKLLYLLYQSEPITPKEATNMFFASTKAFQCKDVQITAAHVIAKVFVEWSSKIGLFGYQRIG